jgi:hypothetical protein
MRDNDVIIPWSLSRTFFYRYFNGMSVDEREFSEDFGLYFKNLACGLFLLDCSIPCNRHSLACLGQKLFDEGDIDNKIVAIVFALEGDSSNNLFDQIKRLNSL